MRRLAAGAVLLTVALQAAAAGAATPSPSPPPEPHKRLNLGLFGSPYAAAKPDPTQNLRFESWVEVIGHPKPSPDEIMMVWWKHFDLGEPSIYGQGYNVRRDGQPNGVNILPLLQKAYDRIRKRK